MNVRCDPAQGGCGTLFTVGAAACPNCQRSADEVAVPNPDGAQPRELDAVGESETEPIVAGRRSRVTPRQRSGSDQGEEKQKDTDE